MLHLSENIIESENTFRINGRFKLCSTVSCYENIIESGYIMQNYW